MSALGPTQLIRKKSCNGILLRLSINPDSAWMTIEKFGAGRELVEIADKDVADVEARFDAIGVDVDSERFMAFVNSVS